MVLDNSSRMKDGDSFNKVILNLDMSKEDMEDCKKDPEPCLGTLKILCCGSFVWSDGF